MGVQCIAIPFRFDDGLALCLESHSVWKKWKWNWNWTEPIQIAKLIIMFTEKCSRLPIRWYPCRKKTTKMLHLHLYNRKIKCRTVKLVSVCAVRAWFFFCVCFCFFVFPLIGLLVTAATMQSAKAYPPIAVNLWYLRRKAAHQHYVDLCTHYFSLSF